MSDLPPNIVTERRHDHGTRKLFDKLASHEKASEQRFELFQDEIIQRLEGHVSYKVLAGTVVTVAMAIIAGIITLMSVTRGQVEDYRRGTDVRFEKIDTAFQSFKAETGTKVEGIYRFLLEKQRPDIVRQQVEEQRRELTPPAAPINPLAPTKPPRK